MVGKIVCDVFPYHSFKQKIRLTKELKHKGRIEVFNNAFILCYYYTKNSNNKN
jgi:hypothetical protein